MKSTFDTSPCKTSEIGFVPGRNTDLKISASPGMRKNRERILLTLSSPGFFGLSQPGGGALPHHNFFVLMMKLGKLVKCFKLYLMTGFWWVNWL